MLLGSDPIELEALPFEHFTGHGKLPATGTELLDWLETEAPWELTRTEFYEQYEFSLDPLPPGARAPACSLRGSFDRAAGSDVRVFWSVTVRARGRDRAQARPRANHSHPQ